ncbi:MAG: aminoacetone oxidase family FAD-binding enzyme [Cytophagaceae bacterium]|jgi:hypothetical protein|nr:aminoacetone oxidase family FAD-binding enzyme [Cytophagaceae bacterium]
MQQSCDVLVIGAGAAGFFGALRVKELAPEKKVIILEKTSKPLAKVKVSGGGRCNVTHHTEDLAYLLKHYPRGQKILKRAFRKFAPRDTVEWFKSRGVFLKVEADGRMFPTTDSSQTIVDCFLQAAQSTSLTVEYHKQVLTLLRMETGWEVRCADGTSYRSAAVLVTTGGFPHLKDYTFLSGLGVQIITPVPSLFSFNLSEHRYQGLEGIAVPMAQVKLMGTGHEASGPLLITHWGFSGPAILQLSSKAARELATQQYQQKFLLNWVPSFKETDLKDWWQTQRNVHGQRQVYGHPSFQFPKRLWERQLELAGMPQVKWAEAPSKAVNKLNEELRNGIFEMKGKTTFKEEFVTAGGVELSQVDPETMMLFQYPGLFMAGEVLDIDALTGGFNFQAAWTTSWIAGTAAAQFPL